jgi:iron complex outermembrane recepter protein
LFEASIERTVSGEKGHPMHRFRAWKAGCVQIQGGTENMQKRGPCLFVGAVLSAAALSAAAQDANSSNANTPEPAVAEVTVTGSRIRQTTDTVAPAPISVVDSESLTERGFVDAGAALGEVTSMKPPISAANVSGSNPGLGSGQAAVGAQYPNLFDLGAGRTLTLVNGRRLISTAGGLGDEAVDANIISVGLLQKIDVVQGGGAAVYGSGAIGGVVNYVLRPDFTGATIDGQYGETSRGDYPVRNIRMTVGTNFAEGKGNIAGSFEFSNTGSILTNDRPFTRSQPMIASNLAPGAGTNGIPSSLYVLNSNTPYGTPNGVVNVVQQGSGLGALLLSNGKAFTFNNAGSSIIPFDPGTPIPGLPTRTVGGDLTRDDTATGLNAIVPGVERQVGNVISSYRLTDNINLSSELTFAKITGSLPYYRDFMANFIPLVASVPGLQPYAFTKNNPYLTADEVAQLSAASPSFAQGGTLYLGKSRNFQLFPDGNGEVDQTTTVYRGLVAADGAFNALQRDFDWSVSYSYAEVNQGVQGEFPIFDRLQKAANAARNSSGQIVCAVNADANPSNDDKGCVPFNIFGRGYIGAAASNYMMTQSGLGPQGTILPSANKQNDVLATLGGEVVTLPAGPLKFSTSYEYRQVEDSFSPLPADRLGVVYSLVPVSGASGSFNTNELAAELSVPIVGRNFTLPAVKDLNFTGSYRFVDHSIAGTESVWGTGLHWEVVDGLSFRGTVSRNFRAPNVAQLLLPASTTLGTAPSPCTSDAITNGPAPAVRYANCLALFEANPAYGASAATPAGSPAAARLAGFKRTGVADVLVTTQGNPDLQNEISLTKSYGVVVQPAFMPGFVLSADRISVHLSNALVPFAGTDFLSACFDSPSRPAQYCNAVTFDASGQTATANSTTINAGSIQLNAETYALNYDFPVAALIGGGNAGRLNFGIQATHNTHMSTTVGQTTTRYDGTPDLPNWQGKLDLRYSRGPIKLNYTMYYLSRVKLSSTATEDNSPSGLAYVASNLRQDISGEYHVLENVSVRAGVNNFTNREPSFPESYYGDPIGRAYFAGFRAEFK